MTRESTVSRMTFGRRDGPFRPFRGGPGMSDHLTAGGFGPILSCVNKRCHERTAGLSIDRVKEPVRLAPASMRHEHRAIAQPATAHDLARLATQKEPETTCSRVPTIRPSSDDPPRFGACAGDR